MDSFFADPLNEKCREIYDYMKAFLVGLSYDEAKAVLSELLSNLGKESIVTSADS